MAYPKKKGNFKRKTNVRKADEREESKTKDFGKANDPSWYIRENQLAKDVASISFNTALGVRTDCAIDNVGGDWIQPSNPYAAPGVMALGFVPAVGISSGAYSPINIAAKNLYSWVRHQNSGSKNYDSPDLILYVMAMDSLYTVIQHLQRAYGTARVYSQLNRYVGDGFLAAMGFKPSDVRANLAQFRAMINMLIVKASAFAIPNTFTLFRRHAWMARCVFQDAPLDKCQTYLYRPFGLFKYNELDGPGRCDLTLCGTEVRTPGSGMQYVNPVQWTVAQWYDYAEDMLSRLTSSEDIGIMSGDILKAYGKENLFTLNLVPEDYVLEVAYSEEILDQIHNTVFAGAEPRTIVDPTSEDQLKTVDLGSWSITQDPSIGAGALLYRPQVFRKRDISIKHILDMYDKEPTPERVLVATRNMIAGSTNVVAIGGHNHTYGTIATCGSDICMSAIIVDFFETVTGWNQRLRNFFVTDGTVAESIVNAMGEYSAFTKAPIVYIFSEAYAEGYMSDLLGQIDNYTLIDRTTLQKMHESAILSMLGVPV